MGAIAGWIAGRNAPDEAALLPALEACFPQYRETFARRAARR